MIIAMVSESYKYPSLRMNRIVVSIYFIQTQTTTRAVVWCGVVGVRAGAGAGAGAGAIATSRIDLSGTVKKK